MNNFIEFLDSYKSKNTNYFDLVDIIKNIDYDFYTNKYIDITNYQKKDWNKINKKSQTNYENWQDKYQLFHFP